MSSQEDNMSESKGFPRLLTDNCICDDNHGDDSMEGADCSCDYYNMLKDVSGQQINGKEWNWGSELDDWLECTKETKNVWELEGSRDQPWPWSLTEGGFRHKKKLSGVPEKGKMLADRLVWNLRLADKILEIPFS